MEIKALLSLTACDIEVVVGFDVSAQNIFSAQTNLLTKMAGILQRISKMAEISCSSGQLPSVRIAMMAMDSASEPVYMDFTNDAESLQEFFRNLRTKGPFVLNGKTISMYTNRFKARQGVTKVVFHPHYFMPVPCSTAQFVPKNSLSCVRIRCLFCWTIYLIDFK